MCICRSVAGAGGVAVAGAGAGLDATVSVMVPTCLEQVGHRALGGAALLATSLLR